jgi:predicted O-methyltransferase YrrM
MNQKIKKKILKIVPYKVINLFQRGIGYIKFKLSIYFDRPYFGNYLFANQTWPMRKNIIKNLLINEISYYNGKDYKVLEIGSWAGMSTILLASVCKTKGKVFCIDTWKACANSPKLMKKAVKRDKIMKMFLHNINSSRLRNIIPIRGSSDNIAEILKPKTFDFIYIDGDHSYTQFKKDLINYSEFCKEGGIICGDDLEINPKELDMRYVFNNKEKDFIEDKKTGIYFHPGIALGIKEFFGEVSMVNGFWFMRKNKNKWEKIILKDNNLLKYKK